jgi:hypothetical protein
VTDPSRRRRNPPWTYDELVLALDVYVRRGLPSVTDPDVVELSAVLNRLSAGAVHPELRTYRNANGVHLKLCNFRAKEHPGHGMAHGNHLEHDVWDRFRHKQDELHATAAAIRNRMTVARDTSPVATQRGGQLGRVSKLTGEGAEHSKVLTTLSKALVREATELHGLVAALDANESGSLVVPDGAVSLSDRLATLTAMISNIGDIVGDASALEPAERVPPRTMRNCDLPRRVPKRDSPKLVIFPCGDAASVRHFNRTVRRPVDLTQRGLNLEPAFTQLRGDYSYAAARVWGVMPRQGGNVSRYGRCSAGDVAVFTGGRKAFCVVTIAGKIRSPQIAQSLWHTDRSGQTWELVFLLSDPVDLHIPYERLSAVLGYRANYAYQSFSVLSEQAAARFREEFESSVRHLWR